MQASAFLQISRHASSAASSGRIMRVLMVLAEQGSGSISVAKSSSGMKAVSGSSQLKERVRPSMSRYHARPTLIPSPKLIPSSSLDASSNTSLWHPDPILMSENNVCEYSLLIDERYNHATGNLFKRLARWCKAQSISKKTFCESNEAEEGWSSLRFALGQALSAAKDLSPDKDPKLALRMTKRDALLIEMYWAQGIPQFRYDRPLKAFMHNEESRSPEVAFSCAIQTAILSAASRFVCWL